MEKNSKSFLCGVRPDGRDGEETIASIYFYDKS